MATAPTNRTSLGRPDANWRAGPCDTCGYWVPRGSGLVIDTGIRVTERHRHCPSHPSPDELRCWVPGSYPVDQACRVTWLRGVWPVWDAHPHVGYREQANHCGQVEASTVAVVLAVELWNDGDDEFWPYAMVRPAVPDEAAALLAAEARVERRHALVRRTRELLTGFDIAGRQAVHSQQAWRRLARLSGITVPTWPRDDVSDTDEVFPDPDDDCVWVVLGVPMGLSPLRLPATPARQALLVELAEEFGSRQPREP
jgi:hypothetical protein